MRYIIPTVVVLLARHLILISAAASVCSSGIYAVLAPLETYPPATSYCASKYPGTITVTVTASPAAKVKRATTTTTTTTKGTTKNTSTKTTSTSTKDAKASAFSSLVAQASAVFSTFCGCAGYPVTTTTTVTPIPTTLPTPCVNGVYRQSSTGNCYNVQCGQIVLGNELLPYPKSLTSTPDACLQACNAPYCVFVTGAPTYSCYSFTAVAGDGGAAPSANLYTQVVCPANKRDSLGELPNPRGRYDARGYTEVN